jgi:hypothetical protein
MINLKKSHAVVFKGESAVQSGRKRHVSAPGDVVSIAGNPSRSSFAFDRPQVNGTRQIRKLIALTELCPGVPIADPFKLGS